MQEFELYKQEMRFAVVKGEFSFHIETVKGDGLTWVEAVEKLCNIRKNGG